MTHATVDESSRASVLAFYLPQYHAIPENDAWWGAGFTDWAKVRAAAPLFGGHNQPRIPSRFGYYDLLDLDAHYAHAELARAYGLAGFCYYAYWFAGRRLLERPLELVAANPQLGMPYAICWANEPWSRRWDGSEQEVLMPQPHDPEGDTAFIDDIAHHLDDPRYVRVAGRPLLLVYRAGILRDPLRTTDGFRERAVKLGIPEPYLAMVQSFGSWEPIAYGFDGAVEFPPHNMGLDQPGGMSRIRRRDGYPQTVMSYTDAIRVSLSREVPAFPWFRGVMVDWDNTPRRRERGTVFLDASPDRFQAWVEEALRCTYLFRPPGERVVFINAWNEWAEGAYLEPDTKHGVAHLAAVQSALLATDSLAADTARAMATGATRGDLLDLARTPWLPSGRRPGSGRPTA